MRYIYDPITNTSIPHYRHVGRTNHTSGFSPTYSIQLFGTAPKFTVMPLDDPLLLVEVLIEHCSTEKIIEFINKCKDEGIKTKCYYITIDMDKKSRLIIENFRIDLDKNQICSVIGLLFLLKNDIIVSEKPEVKDIHPDDYAKHFSTTGKGLSIPDVYKPIPQAPVIDDSVDEKDNTWCESELVPEPQITNNSKKIKHDR
jgi:hypothetical protein